MEWNSLLLQYKSCLSGLLGACLCSSAQLQSKKGQTVSFERSVSANSLIFTSGDGSSPPFCRVTFGKTRKHQNKRVTLTLTGKPIYASGRNTVVLCSGTPTHRADVSASSENRAVYYCKVQESNWSSWQRLKRDYQRRGQTAEQGQELQKLRSQTEELFVLIYLSGLSCVLIRGRSVEV